MNFCNITELEIVIRAFSLDNVHSLDQKDVQYFGHWLCLLQLQVKGRCTAKDYSGIQARSRSGKEYHVTGFKPLGVSHPCCYCNPSHTAFIIYHIFPESTKYFK